MKRKTIRTALRLALALSVISVGSHQGFFAQENRVESRAPSVELLTLKGGKPSLTSDGEGITSYKAMFIYELGPTRVRLDSNFEIELPAGYSLFNNLAYIIDSEATFSGPNDVTFRIPSAATIGSFEKLRILYAKVDDVDPEKAVWVDTTLIPSQAEDSKGYLSKTEFEERLPNFKTRTLHAFGFARPAVFVVASKDSAISRDRFSADLVMKADVTPESVMEGREINYSFEITNNGPDVATGVSFHSTVDAEFVSLNQSQGKCRFEAQNIYCNLGELQKGATATVFYRGRCPWDFYTGDRPSKSGGLQATPSVGSAEGDPVGDNNNSFTGTPVKKDPNLPPLVVIAKPLARSEFSVGSDGTVNIVATASDRDGTVSKVEFFDQGKSIGDGKFTGQGTYELAYRNVAFGPHLLQAIATDNQGRPQASGYTDFTLNGPIQIQVTNPTPNLLLNLPQAPFSVSVRASNPNGSVKKIVVHLSAGWGQQSTEVAQSVGKDEYTATFKELTRECAAGRCYVRAVATNDAGIESSNTVEFSVNSPPQVSLSVAGKNGSDSEKGVESDSGEPLKLVALAGEFTRGGIVKVDFYANDKLIGTDKNEMDSAKEYRWKIFQINWKPTPGSYALTAIAVDMNGASGKSTPVKIMIRDSRR